MREARFEAGAQIPKSSHLAGAPSFSTTSSCERVHKVARATWVGAGTLLFDRILAEHDEQIKQVASVAESTDEVCGSVG